MYAHVFNGFVTTDDNKIKDNCMDYFSPATRQELHDAVEKIEQDRKILSARRYAGTKLQISVNVTADEARERQLEQISENLRELLALTTNLNIHCQPYKTSEDGQSIISA
jgi:divalent metal cation (Fe/Co/Zn/Cd) transporter